MKPSTYLLIFLAGITIFTFCALGVYVNALTNPAFALYLAGYLGL